MLTDAKALAGSGSLIPAEMSYRDQLNRFKAQTAKAGIDHVHGPVAADMGEVCALSHRSSRSRPCRRSLRVPSRRGRG